MRLKRARIQLRRALTVGLVIGALLFSACSKTATIKRRGAVQIEAKISGGDDDAVYVELLLTGGTVPIDRSEVVDIDHPGNVHFLIGSLFTGSGLLLASLGTVLLLSDDPFTYVVGLQLGLNAAIYLAVGVPMGWWGYRIWTRSKRAADLEKSGETIDENRVVIVPQLAPTQDGISAGFGLRGEF